MVPTNCSRLFSCPPFTELRENVDEGLFYCEYEDWAYGLFAILLIILIAMPMIAFLYCFVKSYNKKNSGYNRMKHQRSVTSYDSRFCDSHDTSYEALSGRTYGKISPQRAGGHHQHRNFGNLSSSAPELSIDGYQSLRPHRDVTSSTTSTNIGNKNNANGVPQRRCSFCNDTTEIQGIYCEECGNGSLQTNNKPTRCCSDDLINHRRKAPSPSTVDSVQNPEVTSSRLYPQLDGSLNNHPYHTSPSYDQSDLTQLSNNSAPELQRRKYDQYLLHLVERAPLDSRNGYFTIRDSLSRPNSKVLMLYFSKDNTVSEKGILFYRVCAHSEGGVAFEGSSLALSDMDALISYYRLNRDSLPCCLTIMV